mgnify:FL=1
MTIEKTRQTDKKNEENIATLANLLSRAKINERSSSPKNPRRYLSSINFNPLSPFSKLTGKQQPLIEQREGAGKLFFEKLINLHSLLYGTDYDDKDEEKTKDQIESNKIRNKEIIKFFKDFNLQEKLAEKFIKTQTGKFRVYTSDLFDLKKELEFLKLNEIKEIEKLIKKKKSRR